MSVAAPRGMTVVEATTAAAMRQAAPAPRPAPTCW